MVEVSDHSVHCILTSPPYWGLRDYGTEPLIWDADSACEHVWTSQKAGQFCTRCGAWRGQFGLEPTPELYVQHTMQIMAECWRVLREDGCLFWVIGDTYAGSSCGRGDYREDKSLQRDIYNKAAPQAKCAIKSKSLCLIPYRVAMAMQDAGWIIRNLIVWHKPNHMPESVIDRFTNAYEVIVFAVKTNKTHWWHILDTDEWVNHRPEMPAIEKLPDGTIKRNWRGYCYYFDLDAVRESHKEHFKRRALRGVSGTTYSKLHRAKFGNPDTMFRQRVHQGYGDVDGMVARGKTVLHPKGRNPGDVILTKHDIAVGRGGNYSYTDSLHTKDYHPAGRNPADFWVVNTTRYPEAHFAVYPKELCVRPILCSTRPGDVVLDPFIGSGTTALVARELGRKCIGYDINPEYIALAAKRLGLVERCRSSYNQSY